MKLIQDPSKLKTKIEPTPFNKKEVDEISVTLLQELKRHGGIGLSTNQIGINKRAPCNQCKGTIGGNQPKDLLKYQRNQLFM